MKTERLTATDVIRCLELETLPVEGGKYKSTYYGKPLPDGGTAYSAIYYLLEPDTCSHLHKLTEDEIYHHYMGDPAELLLLYPSGESRIVRLGTDLKAGEVPQFKVPAGVWQGSRIPDDLQDGCGYALLGTTMAPGYTDAMYTHGNDEELSAAYPEMAEKIRRLCP